MLQAAAEGGVHLMRVHVETKEGTILEWNGVEALVTQDERERAEAFVALTGALALLARIEFTLPAATSGGQDPPPPQSGQAQAGRTGGVVVHLATRRDV